MTAIDAALAVLEERLAQIDTELEAIYAPGRILEAEAVTLRAGIRGLRSAAGLDVPRGTVVAKAPKASKVAQRAVKSVDPEPPPLGEPPKALSVEPLPGGRVLRCDCGMEYPGVADLFTHCRDAHQRQPRRDERIPVPPAPIEATG